MKQHPVESGSFLEREGTLERHNVEQRVEAHETEPGETDRLAFVYAEQDMHVSGLPAYYRIHDGVHVAALAVQQQQAHHVAAGLHLVDVATPPQPQPTPQP